jgi:hypothetical protein
MTSRDSKTGLAQKTARTGFIENRENWSTFDIKIKYQKLMNGK